MTVVRVIVNDGGESEIHRETMRNMRGNQRMSMRIDLGLEFL